MSLSTVSLSFPFPKFLVMLLLHFVFAFKCDLGCFHLPLQTSPVSASPRVYFQRRKSSFGFIASPFATYGLLKCEFWGLLGNFPESSCQPSRKSPLRLSFRFLFATFSARISQQQASGLAFTGPLYLCVLWATLPGSCFGHAIIFW